MKFATMSDYDFTLADYEVNDGEELTVPDQSMSLKEMVMRFQRGTLSEDDVYVKGAYDGDYDGYHLVADDVDPMYRTDYDLLDAQEELRNIDSYLKEENERVKKEQQNSRVKKDEDMHTDDDKAKE